MNMSNRFLPFLVIGFLTIIVLIFFTIRLQPINTHTTDTNQNIIALTQPTITFIDPARGAGNASVIIVEFADFACDACRDTHNALTIILRAYPNSVREVWKDLPNESAHPESVPAAIAAHCAAKQGKFWEYADALFARQPILNTHPYDQIASDLKLDEKRFKTCTDSKETLPIIQKNTQEARALDLIATPTLFIGSEKTVGTVSADDLMKLVEEHLPRK